ncbi:MAG: EAL domain-containing protein [Pseudomonadota bacterium]|jgi:EAL domain-containing protein (putative c-di-GMP-specific phosphodiesterase class I)
MSATLGGGENVLQLIDDGRPYPVFQPLVSMETGQVYAYEALIRGPDGSEFHRPDRLFGAARAHGLTGRLEIACCETAIRGFAKLALPGKLFLNAGAPAIERFGSPLVAEGIETEAELAILRDLGVAYGQGYFLGRPDKRPDAAIPAYAAAAKRRAKHSGSGIFVARRRGQ